MIYTSKGKDLPASLLGKGNIGVNTYKLFLFFKKLLGEIFVKNLLLVCRAS
jgi:hypothetical protein